MLKRLFLLLFGLVMFNFVPSAAGKSIAPTCTPAKDEVAVFVDTDFGGDCGAVKVGSYEFHKTFPLPNDAISSIKIGADVFVTICQDEGFKGICNTLYGSVEDLNLFTTGNDTISSFMVQSRQCLPDVNEVALFDELAYGGHCTVLKQGVYNDWQQLHIRNDAVASVLTNRLKSGVFVTLCEHSDLNGACETVTQDDVDLRDNPIIQNSEVSSAVVQSMSCYPDAGQAVIFNGAAYSKDCAKLAVGDYTKASALAFPIGRMASLLVSEATGVKVCGKPDFAGCQDVTQSTAHLSKSAMDTKQIVSIRVYPLTQ